MLRDGWTPLVVLTHTTESVESLKTIAC